MTRRTVTLILCDMPHTQETDAQTVTITVPGHTPVEVDLCTSCTASQLGTVLAQARPVRKASRPRPARK